MSKPQEILKIAIIGLHNAGKTSIIKSIFQEFSLLSHLKPTQGVERQEIVLFGQTLIFWDFGGQEVYRSKYIEGSSRYFSNINTMFYVVDVRDPSLLDESIEYFKKIIVAVKENNPTTRVNILFNKWDPVVLDPKDIEIRNSSKMKFLDQALPLIPETFPALIFETSIFKPLSIINAISIPIFNKDDFHTNVSILLSSIVERNKFLFSLAFSEKFFELGRAFPKNIDEASLSEAIMGFFEMYKSQIQFAPYFILDCKTYKLISSRILVKYHDKEYPVILALGFDKTCQISESDMSKMIGELKGEIGKLFNNVNFGSVLSSKKI